MAKDKRTAPVTRSEIDQMDAKNPGRLYKKDKYVPLDQLPGYIERVAALKALKPETVQDITNAMREAGIEDEDAIEFLKLSMEERQAEGGIMSLVPVMPKPGRPKYVPLLDKQALVSLRESIRVPSHALSKRMGWPKYMWSRLENENVNFSLERGVSICVTLRVDIRTLLLPENRAKVDSILTTYEINLESNLRDQYIEDWIDSEGGQSQVLDDEGMNPEDLETADEDQKWEWATEIADNAIGNKWQEDKDYTNLQVVRSRMEDADQKLQATFDKFFKKKNELEILFSEITEKYRKGLLELGSPEGVLTEVKHSSLCLDLVPLWRELDAAHRDGTLPSGISPRLIENPAKEQAEWFAESKAEEEMAAAQPSWDEMNPDHPRSSLNKSEQTKEPYQPGEQEVQSAAPPPQPATQLPQLPIYGSARAGSDSIDLDRGAAALSWTERPYFLGGVGNAYALYVSSDSMYPAFRDGALLFVHPSKPVRVGDDCIVEIQKENEEPIGLVKRLLSKSNDKFVFEQFNPPARIEFAASEIKTLHLVVGSLASGS